MKSNLLHMNLGKSCYVHFKPINRKGKEPDELQTKKLKKSKKTVRNQLKQTLSVSVVHHYNLVLVLLQVLVVALSCICEGLSVFSIIR